MDTSAPPAAPAPVPLTPLGARTPHAHPALYGVIAFFSLVIIAGAIWVLWPDSEQTPMPTASATPPPLNESLIPEGWDRFDASLVNLSFYHPADADFKETDSLSGTRFLDHTGTIADFSPNNGGPGTFAAVTKDFSVMDTIPHDIVDGTLESADTFEVTVYDKNHRVVREIEPGIFQVTGYGNLECSPFVSSILLVRPPAGSGLQYIQFFLGSPDDPGFLKAQKLSSDPCTPTDSAIQARIDAVVTGQAPEVNERLELALRISRTFDTSPMGPYPLECSPTGDAAAIDDWGRRYEWYPRFKQQLAPGWSLTAACYSRNTSEVVYLKTRGNAEPDIQLGIFHINADLPGIAEYFSKAPQHRAPLYGTCNTILRWTQAEIAYACRGGDAGMLAYQEIRYEIARGLLEQTRTCTVTDVDSRCDATAQRIAQIDPWCSSTAMPMEIGGELYPSDPKYEHMGGYLAAVLTAADCGDARFSEVVGGNDTMYAWGISLRMRSPLTNEVMLQLRSAGFTEVPPSETQTPGLDWILTGSVPVRNILFLRSISELIERADCVHCG